MNCRKAQRFIYLLRGGELSDDEALRLTRHLQSCPACTREQAVAFAGEQRVALLRAVTPTVSDGPELTREIMRAMRQTHDTQRFAAEQRDIIFVPRVRVALGMLLLTVTSVLFFQTARDALQISFLEDQLSARNSGAFRSLSEALGGQSAKLAMGGSLSDLLLDINHKFPVTAKLEGTATIASVFPITRNDSIHGRITFEQYVRNRYPDLARVRLDDGLDRHERKLLETEGKALLRDIEAWSQKEE
jgi:hypothetical protein